MNPLETTVMALMPPRTPADDNEAPQRRTRVYVDELMTVADIAELFGVPNQHVQGFIQRRDSNDFPEPVVRLKSVTLFKRPEIEKWMEERNRKRPRGRQHRILGATSAETDSAPESDATQGDD